MSEIITFSSEEAVPARADVLSNQGVPAEKVFSGEIEAIYAKALGLLVEVAAPAGIVRAISRSEFASVYHGEGRNEPHTPVGEIFGRADDLALFAVTLGERISREISRRFESNDFALAAMLDSAASAAADRLAGLTQTRLREELSQQGHITSETGILRYSPGYCGWHISGQKRLFEFLHPERIGITLTDSFLMIPLKSVSGVLIAGPRDIHDFPDTYPFCSRCETRGCRARLRALLAE